jgi:hypothetical protein
MTPKEKAVELMLKYHSLIPMNTVSFAKQCALIAVDEIILQVNELSDSEWYLAAKQYLYEVKQEIEKL